MPGARRTCAARPTRDGAASSVCVAASGGGSTPQRQQPTRHPVAKQRMGKLMRLSTAEFIRRFLLHALPGGFRRIRYYGFLAVRARKTRLARCRRLFRLKQAENKKGSRTCVDIVKELTGFDPLRCLVRKLGTLVRVCLVPR